MLLQQILAALAEGHKPRPKNRIPDPAPVPARLTEPAGPPPNRAVQGVYGAGGLEEFLALPYGDQVKAIEEELTKLSAAEQRLVMEALAVELDRKWIPQPGPQTDAVRSQADLLLYGGAGGGGKGLRPDCPVLTPFGWRPIGRLKVGDAICATDGTVTRVIGVWRRGVQPLYRLTFADGSVIECDADHIWQGWRAGKSRKIANEKVGGAASCMKWTAQQLWEHYQAGRQRVIIPVISAPVAFNVTGRYLKRPVPPYVLGALLGDGRLAKHSISITSGDPEIVARMEEELGCRATPYRGKRSVASFRFPNAVIMPGMKALGLVEHGSADKFIPRQYLFAPVEDRLALLQGLMDTDGWAEAKRAIYFTTVSERLAHDVRHLVRSLGGIVTLCEKFPKYTCNGEKRRGQKAYTLRIKMPAPERAFFLERKRRICREHDYQCMGLPLVSIEPCGEGETVCISVAHPNSLFIADGFLVTHNSETLLGLALTQHKRSLIMRREYGDLAFLTERIVEINGSRNGFRQSPYPLLRTDDGRLIEFGAAQRAGDEQAWQGRPHDFLGIDEAAQFLESQVRFLMGWVRSTDPEQRTRVVLASNPPLSDEGFWLIGMFAPWLDPQHPNPAKPGELRWFVTDEEGRDREVDGPGPHRVGRKMVRAQSRTFIPARLQDNVYLTRTDDYERRLDALPEPLRSAVRDGNFMAARTDDAFQVIPSDWIRLAQERWTETPPAHCKTMTCIALDPAGGGRDAAAMAYRFGSWFGHVITERGPQTRDGRYIAARLLVERRNGCQVVVDVGGGYGNEAVSTLEDNEAPVISFRGSDASTEKAQGSGIEFYNLRAELWWRFREALDPLSPHKIALPPDPEVASDLAAPRLNPRALQVQGKILVESKEDIRKRLGRSPDKGDAIVMCWRYGGLLEYQKQQDRPQVNIAHEEAKRRYGHLPRTANVGHRAAKRWV